MHFEQQILKMGFKLTRVAEQNFRIYDRGKLVYKIDRPVKIHSDYLMLHELSWQEKRYIINDLKDIRRNGS